MKNPNQSLKLSSLSTGWLLGFAIMDYDHPNVLVSKLVSKTIIILLKGLSPPKEKQLHQMKGEVQACAKGNQSPSCDFCHKLKSTVQTNATASKINDPHTTLWFTFGFYSILSFNVVYTMWLHYWASTSRWASHTVWPSLPNSLTASFRLCICRIWRNAI